MKRLANSFGIAFSMYSRIPMVRCDWTEENMKYVMCFFPWIGAVIGALAGSAIEKGVTNQTGIEYVVKTDNGETLTLVQGPSPAFTVGQKVMVLYGKRARIIAAQ